MPDKREIYELYSKYQYRHSIDTRSPPKNNIFVSCYSTTIAWDLEKTSIDARPLSNKKLFLAAVLLWCMGLGLLWCMGLRKIQSDSTLTDFFFAVVLWAWIWPPTKNKYISFLATVGTTMVSDYSTTMVHGNKKNAIGTRRPQKKIYFCLKNSTVHWT